MSRIHPSAVIDPGAELAAGVEVGAYCVIGEGVEIGPGSVLFSHVTILGETSLGERNVVYPGAVLGAAPQDRKHRHERTRLLIGDGNCFREHTTVHPGTTAGGGVTSIGSNCLLMAGSHVAHDCHLADFVTLANHVLLAGHVRVQERATLNGAAACHHYTTIGRLAYVGGLSRIVADVPPFSIVEGHPARIRACNVVGMRRTGIPEAQIATVRRALRSIFLSREDSAAAAIRRLEGECGEDPLVAELLAFVQASARGRQGRSAEALA